MLDYGEGIVGRLAVEGTAGVSGYTCALHSEHRTAVASGPNVVDLTLFVIEDGETSELDCAPSPYAKFASINANVPLLMELYDEFVKKIEGRADRLPSFEDGLVTQEVLAAIGYSAPNGVRQ